MLLFSSPSATDVLKQPDAGLWVKTTAGRSKLREQHLSHPWLQETTHRSELCPGLSPRPTPEPSKAHGMVIKPNLSAAEGRDRGHLQAMCLLSSNSSPQNLFPTRASDTRGEFNIGDDLYVFHWA